MNNIVLKAYLSAFSTLLAENIFNNSTWNPWGCKKINRTCAIIRYLKTPSMVFLITLRAETLTGRILSVFGVFGLFLPKFMPLKILNHQNTKCDFVPFFAILGLLRAKINLF